MADHKLCRACKIIHKFHANDLGEWNCNVNISQKILSDYIHDIECVKFIPVGRNIPQKYIKC